MSGEYKSVRTRREIKESLLRRAFDEDRGPEVIAAIQECLKRAELSEEEKDALIAIRLTNTGQPRSVRMLNALARHEGSKTWFTDNSSPTIH